MTNHYDDDPDFWGDPPSDRDRTEQVDRVRRNSLDRTRTHHVVRREQPLDEHADEATMWIEPSSRIAERLGPLGSVDPRVLSFGAVALAAVLAVPLFSAFGGGDDGDVLRAVKGESTTTAVTVVAEQTEATEPAAAVVVTAALDGAAGGGTSAGADDEASSQEAPPAPETAEDSTARAQPLAADPDCANEYTAAAGDYWLRIAEGSGTELDALLEVNEATAQTPIYPGSTICLPEGQAVPAAYSASNDDSAGGTTAAPAEPEACGNVYETVAGDYWLRIADAAALELDEILELNDATPDTPLYPGSEVCLPVGAPRPTPPTTAAAPTTAAPSSAPAPTPAPTTAAPATDPPTTAATTTEPETTVPAAPPPPSEIEQIIRDVWPDDLEEQALRIAWRESGYNPRAQNYCCSGLFQIYYDVHASWLADLGIDSASDLYDPRLNATAAFALYQRAGSWEPWRMTAD